MKKLFTAILLVSALASSALASDAAATVTCKAEDGSTSQVATAADCKGTVEPAPASN